jgi:hypothetical protein
MALEAGAGVAATEPSLGQIRPERQSLVIGRKGVTVAPQSDQRFSLVGNGIGIIGI